jgi:hypothetical protein
MAPLPARLDDLIAYVRDEQPDGGALDHVATAVAVSERLGELADHLIGHFVDEARRAGASWTDIGQSMGVTKQAAQKRFVPRVDDLVPSGGQLSRFTSRARQAVNAAQAHARHARRAHVGSEHVLLGLLDGPDALGGRALVAQGLSLEELRRGAEAVDSPTTAAPLDHVPFSGNAKKLLELTFREALRLNHNYIGTEHMLLALIADDGAAGSVLRAAGADATAADAWIRAELARRQAKP